MSARCVNKSIYSPRSRQLAVLLKRLRTKNQLAMTTVALRIGRHHPYVKDYEDGQRRLDVVQLMEVAWALGSSLAAIAEFLTDNPPPEDGSPSDGFPEFAVVGEQGSHSSPVEDERDEWYQGEWSRLCALLRAVRMRSRRSDGQPLREQDVADRLDVKQSFVSKYETKNRRLDFVELEQVAIASDTTLLQLVTEFERGARPYGVAANGGANIS